MTAESTIGENDEQFRLLIEGVRDYAIVMLDVDGRIATWNAGAERILGYDAEEIVGEHFSRFYPEPDRREGRPERELHTASTAGRFEEEGWRVRRDGSRFRADVVVTPLRDDDGRLRGFAKITRDVTERYTSARRIRELNAELEAQIAQLAAGNRDLAQQSEENETFVYSVSHDLRSPLVNLQGFSKELELVCGDLRGILVDNELPEDVRRRGLTLIDEEMGESIHFIQTAVLRLSHIIDALLRLSRAGRVEYRRKSLDVHGIVCRIVESLSVTIAKQDVRVTVRDLPPAWGDPTAIEQVFANLIGNALKYLDPDRPGVVEIGYRGEAERSDGSGGGAYYVRDNGLGIAEEYHVKVFQPFQRVHAGVASGEGLGLPLVRRIVERHGGSIRVESAAGEGSTFLVSLPTVPAAESEPRRNEPPHHAEEGSRENGRRTAGHRVG